MHHHRRIRTTTAAGAPARGPRPARREPGSASGRPAGAHRAAPRGAPEAARAGGDGAALAAILERITDADDEKPDAVSFLRSHPFTAERAARLRSLAGEKPTGPGILSEAEWASLQGICPKQAKPEKPEKRKPADGETTTPTEKL